MKIFVLHNRYRFRGGEDVCVDNEIRLLNKAGLDLMTDTPQTPPGAGAILGALMAPLGWLHQRRVEQRLAAEKPDILHVHNLFPQFSPRIFSRAKSLGIRIIQTLHNYRPLCLNGLFLTPSKEICERCAIKQTYTPGILRGCYRGNRLASALMATNLRHARNRGYNDVDHFIAPGQFLRDKFVSHGWPAHKISVQPHALSDSIDSGDPAAPEPYLLYLGRFSDEKGVRWLLQVFQKRNPAPIPIRFAGSGPLESELREGATEGISIEGFLGPDAKHRVLSRAKALVLASACYENAPLAILEAQALGVPVLAPRMGGFTEMVQPDVNGFLYTPGHAASFWEAVEQLQQSSWKLRQTTQADARERYAPGPFMEKRLQLYQEVMRS